MAFDLILRLESTHCCPQDLWWLVQEGRCLELLALYRFAKVVLSVGREGYSARIE
jgi:hypothetical protein